MRTESMYRCLSVCLWIIAGMLIWWTVQRMRQPAIAPSESTTSVYTAIEAQPVTIPLSAIRLSEPPQPKTATVSRNRIWAAIENAWDLEHQMIKRWWSAEEEQAKSLPTASLRQQYEEQAQHNFRRRDEELKAKYSKKRKEVALLPKQVDAEFLNTFQQLHREEMQAKDISWRQNRQQELNRIRAWYEEQRRQEALSRRINKIQRQVEQNRRRF